MEPGSLFVPRYHCDDVNGVKGCCKNGRTCGGTRDDAKPCASVGYVRCPKENFCCRRPFPLHHPSLPLSTPTVIIAVNYQCFRDDAGSPQCRSSTSNSTDTSPIPGVSLQAAASDASKSSFNLLGLVPFLGLVGEIFFR